MSEWLSVQGVVLPLLFVCTLFVGEKIFFFSVFLHGLSDLKKFQTATGTTLFFKGKMLSQYLA